MKPENQSIVSNIMRRYKDVKRKEAELEKSKMELAEQEEDLDLLDLKDREEVIEELTRRKLEAQY